MKRLILCLALAALVVLPEINLDARGRGGGGGGGGFSRGGGGMSRPAPRPSTPSFNRPAPRPSTPSINRPSPRPSTPARPTTRPSTPSRPSVPSARPSLPSSRPSTRPSIPSSPSQRPSIKPETRPSIPNTGNRPGTLPGTGNRPSLPGTGNRPGTLPGTGNRPGTLPGTGNRPSTLPGTVNRPGDRPGLGNRPSQLPNRPSVSDRRANLNNSFNDRNSFRNNNININRTEINNRWDNNRGRWDNNWHNRHWYHNGWYHGHCHWGWRPGYMWNRYPVLTAFGVTTWAINRWNWVSGYYPYSNPYATPVVINQSSTYYDYSQPILEAPSDPEAADEAAAPPPAALSVFDKATQEFKQNQFQTALDSVNEALKQSPNDAAIHEFRALTLFAIGRYDEAAATLYAVLGVGPGWDWTTMISLYSSSEVYTEQLRKLEAFTKSNPNNAAARFVLAYHYITQGHENAAVKQLTQVVKLQPNDPLARDLLLGMDPDADIPKPEVVEPPKPTEKVTAEELQGTWSAERGNGEKFTMALDNEGKFTWTYQSGDQKQDVSGVWAVDDDGILALDMGDDDKIVAQIDPQGSNSLDFYMVGDTQGAEPLHFKK